MNTHIFCPMWVVDIIFKKDMRIKFTYLCEKNYFPLTPSINFMAFDIFLNNEHKIFLFAINTKLRKNRTIIHANFSIYMDRNIWFIIVHLKIARRSILVVQSLLWTFWW